MPTPPREDVNKRDSSEQADCQEIARHERKAGGFSARDGAYKMYSVPAEIGNSGRIGDLGRVENSAPYETPTLTMQHAERMLDVAQELRDAGAPFTAAELRGQALQVAKVARALQEHRRALGLPNELPRVSYLPTGAGYLALCAHPAGDLDDGDELQELPLFPAAPAHALPFSVRRALADTSRGTFMELAD